MCHKTKPNQTKIIHNSAKAFSILKIQQLLNKELERNLSFNCISLDTWKLFEPIVEYSIQKMHYNIPKTYYDIRLFLAS